MTTPTTISIDGIDYIRVDLAPIPDGVHVIIRSLDSGVWAGILPDGDHKSDVVTLHGARRLWYWSGAATLSELAMTGPGNPDACKFPISVPVVTVLGVCEIIPMTAKAWDAIAAVPVWSAQ